MHLSKPTDAHCRVRARVSVTAAVRKACKLGILEQPRATLPQGAGPPLATLGRVRDAPHNAALGEAAKPTKGSSAWWARPIFESSQVCRALQPCLEEWEGATDTQGAHER